MLTERGIKIPTVFLSGHGDVATSVARSAPVRSTFSRSRGRPRLTPRSRNSRIVDAARRQWEEEALTTELRARVGKLTRREREVFSWVAAGRLNKQIAAALGTTENTIKVHRARVMTKMQAESIADLVRMYDTLNGEKREASRETREAVPALG